MGWGQRAMKSNNFALTVSLISFGGLHFCFSSLSFVGLWRFFLCLVEKRRFLQKHTLLLVGFDIIRLKIVQWQLSYFCDEGNITAFEDAHCSK